MEEIEVKVLNIDKKDILEKIALVNGKLIKKEFQENHMFQEKGGYVRIRRSTSFLDQKEKIIITSKELISKNKFKISKEIEFQSYEFENAKLFLESLGLKKYRLDEKYRESYELEEGLIEIDTWAGIPTYLEVEADSEKKVEVILEKIGYSLEDSTSMTLKEIMGKFNIPNTDRIFTKEEKSLFLI